MEARFGERRKRPIFTLRDHAVALTAAAVVVLAPATGYSGAAGPTGPSTAVKFEAVPGSDLKRVILTERAAERLGIQMGEVHEAEIIRTQIVGGRIVPPPEELPQATASTGGFAGFAHLASVTEEQVAQPVGSTSEVAVQRLTPEMTPPDLRRAWVLVTLSPDEWERMRKDQPARILRLQTRVGDGLLAKPTGEPPREDLKRTMLSAFYEIPGEDHGLLLNERVRVEVELADSGQVRKVVPYDAVWYDNKGKAWVYASTEHLVYVRMPIEIERIEGDLAVLKDGPPLGTQVVTTGAPLLYGAEVIYKR